MVFLILWFLCILVVSVIPVSTPQTDFSQGDKLAHVLMYGLTSVFVYRTYSLRTAARGVFFLSVAVSSLYGAAMEGIQYFLPYRSFSAGDIIANTAGAFLGSVLYIKGKS